MSWRDKTNTDWPVSIQVKRGRQRRSLFVEKPPSPLPSLGQVVNLEGEEWTVAKIKRCDPAKVYVVKFPARANAESRV